LLKIKKWGIVQKNKVDNTNEWATWRWANAKTKQQSPYIVKKRLNPKFIKQDIKDYYCTMFKHAMKFLKQLANLKKSLSKHYFTNFLKDLSTENLVTLCKLLATKIAKLLIKLDATLGK
jgi:hypothetical protein